MKTMSAIVVERQENVVFLMFIRHVWTVVVVVVVVVVIVAAVVVMNE